MEQAREIEETTEYLPLGTQLLNGTYEITDHLGAGGFGLTYLADDQIGRKVVLKECFPASFCRREGLNVRTQTAAQQENFDKLIKNFVNEARQLAKLKHPNVVPVLHFFEEHDTAYISLEYIKGDDLSVGLREGKDLLPPERIIEIATGMLRALDYIHSRGLLHRDIAPDNVIINDADQPVLIDFGASRNETAQAVTRLLSQQLRAVKDGYSPQEFYMPGRPHTPASDLYSLAATIYTLITGEVPIDAYNRLVDLSKKEPDPLRRLAGRVKGYPESFLKALDKAMSLLPKDRPQSAEEMRVLMAPNVGNVTPMPRKASEPRAKSQPKPEGPVAPKRPSRDPSQHSVRPPAIDTSAPPAEIAAHRTNPSEPRRVVKPRVLTRSSEQPRAGTVPIQPPAVPPAEPVDVPPTLPETTPIVRSPEPSVADRPADAPRAQKPEPSEWAKAETIPQTHSSAPGGASNASLSPVQSALSPEPTQTVIITAPTSTLDKIIRGVAIAVILAGGFVFAGGPSLLSGNDVSTVPTEVANFTAGAIPAPTDVAAALAPAAAAPAATPPVAAPEPAAVATAPTPAGPPVGVQTAWAENGWAVTLNLPLASSGGDVVFAPSGASPYPAGTILVSVGGRDAGDDPAGIAALAASYFSFADPDTPRLPVSVRNLQFDSRGDSEIRVDVSRVVEFGAFTLSQRADGEGWKVSVAIARPGSGLRDGDVILSEASTGTPVRKTADLETVFATLRATGAADAVLLVERSGATQAIPVALSQISEQNGAG